MGGAVPKCFLRLAGLPLFAHSLQTFYAVGELEQTALVVPAGTEQEATRLVTEVGIPPPTQIVAGGATRAESVRAGLAALAELPPEIVVIHDGARPLATVQLFQQTIQAARHYGAALAAIPLTDTLKRAGDDLLVADTPSREGLWRAQTPQTFRFELIREAHRRAQEEGWPASDDAVLVEQLGHPVRLCPSSETNLKVTTPQDLARAKRLLGASRQRRVGHGYDLHRLVPGRPLILGGLEVPYEKGLLGHSDGDVACHALADALLGAVAQGDIGLHFPDSDPQYAGADSTVFLRQVSEKIAQAGFAIVNCDITLQAEEPRLRPHLEAMRRRLAEVLGLDPGQVSIKATTTEGVGPIGEKQAMAAHAVVLLES